MRRRSSYGAYRVSHCCHPGRVGEATETRAGQVPQFFKLDDAISFLAFALPRRLAICWGRDCVGLTAGDGPLSPADAAAFSATNASLEDASDERRWTANEAARAAEFRSVEALLALAVYASGGSMAPPGAAEAAPPPPDRAGIVTGALVMSAGRVPFERMAATKAASLDGGIAYAEGAAWRLDPARRADDCRAMRLTLKIENHSALAGGQPLIQVLDRTGLQMGRAAYVDWQLADPQKLISSEHAEIQFRDGGYVLRDRSKNGTYINGARIEAANREVPLNDGDRIAIGHYEMSVRIVGDDPHLAPLEKTSESATDKIWGGGDWGKFNAARPEPVGVEDRRIPVRTGDVLSSAFEATADVTAASGGSPWESWSSQPPQSEPAPRAAPRGKRRGAADPDAATRSTPSSDNRGLDAFLRSVGLDTSTAPAQAGIERAGETLRVLVAGLCDLLKRQGDMKSVLGVERTTVRLADNNIFKFSASPDDAVARIFAPQPSDMPGPIAAERSFGDIRKHEERLLTAINDAVRRIVEKLSPLEIKRRETGGMIDMLIPGGRKASWWDELERQHAALLNDDGARLDELIEEELRGAFTRHL